MARKLYFDTTSRDPRKALVKDFGNLSPGEKPVFVLGDNNPTEIYLLDAASSYHPDSGGVGVTAKLAIVTPGAQPTGGTYKLEHDSNATTALDYNDSAADIQTALNALASITTAGGVVVSGSFPCYTITYNNTGAQNDITQNENSLTPDGTISVSVVTAGDGSTEEVLSLKLSRAPHAIQETWADIGDGWSADFAMVDRKLCTLIGTGESVETTLELQITDGSGKVRTYGQVDCILLNEGILDGITADMDPTTHYSKTEADNLFLKKAQDLADVASASTSRTNLGISAANTPFTPGDNADWTVVPSDVKDALDELADRTNGISATKTALTTATPSATGETNIDPTDSDAITTVQITPGAGSGAYTHDFILQHITPGESAPIVMVHVNMPASDNPTITIKDEGPTDSTGDDITEITISGNSKIAKTEFIIFVWDNSNSEWDLLYSSVGRANGLQSIFVPAAAMIARTTNGPAEATAESTTNKIMQKTLDFDSATDEHAQFSVTLPKSWDSSTGICARFHWQTTASANDVIWAIQAVCIANNVALDSAFGTAQTVTDTVVNANRNHVTDYTSAMTPANAADDCLTVFEVYRDADAGGDTLASDAKLLGVELLYQVTNGSEDL